MHYRHLESEDRQIVSVHRHYLSVTRYGVKVTKQQKEVKTRLGQKTIELIDLSVFSFHHYFGFRKTNLCTLALMKTFLLLLFLLSAGICGGQNFVPNRNFEQFNSSTGYGRLLHGGIMWIDHESSACQTHWCCSVPYHVLVTEKTFGGTRHEIPKGNLFCRMEDKLTRATKVWIKVGVK